MLEGLRTAAAGMAAQQQQLDAVSNDLANVDTNGYKRVRVGFRDLALHAGRPPERPGRRDGAGARAVDRPRLRAGRAAQHRQPLDLAIQGDGFLQVASPTAARPHPRRQPAPRRQRPPRHRHRRARPARDQHPRGRRPSPRSRSPPTAPSLAAGQPSAASKIVTVRSPQGLRPSATTPSWPRPPPAPPPPRPADARSRRARSRARTSTWPTRWSTMMEAQRSYQLASKAIPTADQMMEIANGVKR